MRLLVVVGSSVVFVVLAVVLVVVSSIAASGGGVAAPAAAVVVVEARSWSMLKKSKSSGSASHSSFDARIDSRATTKLSRHRLVFVVVDAVLGISDFQGEGALPPPLSFSL